MNKVLELTDAGNGQPLYVNAVNILYFTPISTTAGNTQVFMQGASITVTEPAENIKNYMEAPDDRY